MQTVGAPWRAVCGAVRRRGVRCVDATIGGRAASALPQEARRTSGQAGSRRLVHGSVLSSHALSGPGGWTRGALQRVEPAGGAAPQRRAGALSRPRCAHRWAHTSRRVEAAGGAGEVASPGDGGAVAERDLDAVWATQATAPYPQFQPTHSIEQFVAAFHDLEPGARAKHEHTRVAGRVVGKRAASGKLVFFDIEAVARDGSPLRLQVMCVRGHYEGRSVDISGSGGAGDEPGAVDDGAGEHFGTLTHTLRRGDVIGIRGFPGKSKRGELSIIPFELQLLAPCVPNLPDKRSRMRDVEVRHRARHVDMLVNTDVRDVLYKRSKVIRELRNFLEGEGFVEVETPILYPSAGGATAQAFETHARAFDADLRLRIAPELFLKQLVIGGMDRVFEVGKVFRNEGITPHHSPEFTMCEFYCAFATRDDLMKLTEELLRHIVVATTGSAVLHLPAELAGGSAVAIDFDEPFRVVSVPDAIEAKIGRPLPHPESPTAVEELNDIVRELGDECPAPLTVSRLIDRLIGILLEPECVQPTFLCDHPVALSPLARQQQERPGFASRFELFVGGRELCNAYAELNDPAEQRARFERQDKDRGLGDSEAHAMDGAYCEALRYGLPPTGGWGMGIDRLTMLLTGRHNIREVISFPVVKPRSASD